MSGARRTALWALCAALCALRSASAAAPAPDGEERFALRIDIGRTSVLIGRALDGLGVSLPDVLGGRDEGPDLEVLWRALREAARDGVVLKELACAKGAALRKACRAFKAPEWIGAQPTPVPALAVLQERVDALFDLLRPFIDAGCKAGVRRTKEPLFCSVE